MSRVADFLKLIRLQYTRKLYKELLLIIETILIVILLSVVCVPLSNALQLSSGVEEALPDFGKMIYYSQSIGAVDTLPLDSIAESVGNHVRVYYSKSYETVIDSKTVNVIVLSHDLFDDVTLKLNSGTFSCDNSQYAPALISPSLGQSLYLGDTLAVETGDGNIPIKITGILSDNSTVIDIKQQLGSFHTLDAVGFHLSYYQEREIDFIITAEDDSNNKSTDEPASAVFKIANTENLNETLDDLMTNYAGVASFDTCSALKDNLIQNTLQKFKWEGILLFLLVIVLVFNFIGYLIMNMHQKEHLMSILHICGLSYAKSVAINITAVLALLIPSVTAGLLLSPFVMDGLSIQYYGYNKIVFISIVCLFLLCGLVSVAIGSIRRKRRHISEQYKKTRG